MRLTRRSVVLLVVAAVFAVLNLFRGGPAAVDAMPTLLGVAPELVVRVQISTPIEKLRMERVANAKGSANFDKWQIVSPLEFPADAAQINTLLRTFGPGLKMEAQVDAGNLEDYGVDDQNGRLVELFVAGEDTPKVSLVVGKTAAGPSAFVRIPGANVVFRADVGGAGRFSRPAADWRDKVAVDIDRTTVNALTLVRGPQTLRFTRGPSTGLDKKGAPLPGPWLLADAPFAIDGATVDATIKTLSRIRSGEIHNPDYEAGLATPAAVATLGLTDGTSVSLTLGSRAEEGASLIRVSGRDEVFRVSDVAGKVMTQPVEAFRDRTLLSFAKEDVASMAYVDRGLTVVLAQSDDGTSWTVTQPANMDVDQRQAAATVAALAELRAAGIPADDTFAATGARFEVRFHDGRSQAIELGQSERDSDNRPLVRVRVVGKPGVFQLREATLTELRKAFGRG